MLDGLRQFIADVVAPHSNRTFDDTGYRLAATALLIHVVSLDGEPSERAKRKLHGLIETHFGLDAGSADDWNAADLAPYIDRALELFGPQRLMFGSDWPVANLRGGYSKVWRETNLVLARLSPDERDCILGGTAIEFYRLPITDPLP